MNRTFSDEAIILSLKPSGENNSTVTLLTKKQGIIFAVLYGGPKSKMKSLVAQWNSGIIYLYENPEKNQIKISDFDVKKYHASFSQNLYKAFAANLAAELCIKTRCGGSNEQAYTLLNGFLDGMELSDEDQSRVGMIRFLWRYLELLGVQPDATFCSSCGKSFITSGFAPNSDSYYNIVENNFSCCECGKTTDFFPVKTKGVHYLAGISVLTPMEARKLQIDKETFEQLKQIIFFLIERNLDTKLNTLEAGSGIL